MANAKDYVTRIHGSPMEIDATQWNGLLAQSDAPTPFMRHEYLAALYACGCASAQTGWHTQFVALYDTDTNELLAACPLYLKDHSYGEYVFDWAWAHAYQEHGLAYYPKAVVAVPFTPVPGSRLLCKRGFPTSVLLREALTLCQQKRASSLHTLFASPIDLQAAAGQSLMLRETVQFHWANAHYDCFDTYLDSLTQDKRKKIRAERRKVREAGVTWRWSEGAGISDTDWDFFYLCYERTYLEHGNLPYLNRDFFRCMQQTMPENWLLFVAMRAGRPIACSLLGLQRSASITAQNAPPCPSHSIAYGRYWGAIERIDSLHFEACYYQPLQWCIEHGFDRFEGGAQGEHKMARGLLPVVTHSAHWLAHPQFADAVARFLDRETQGIEQYVKQLAQRNPFR